MESIKNRNRAYFNIIEKLPQKKQLIYQIICEEKKVSAWQISIKYMLPINEVVGRITELKERCLIEENGSFENVNSRQKNTAYSAIKEVDEIRRRINLKYAGLKNNYDMMTNDYLLGMSVFSKEILEKERKKIKNKIENLEQTLKLLKGPVSL